MPRPYPPEFRRRAIALVKSGRTVAKTVTDLERRNEKLRARPLLKGIDYSIIRALQERPNMKST